jgi:ATPase family AAA domain-containing protein 3A/B
MITAFNIVGSQIHSLFTNPKMLMKAAYMSIIIFGCFHGTRLGVAMLGQSLIGRFNKPTLVRETSKIYSSNYLTLPFVWARKQMLMKMKRTEKDLLEGVILEKKLEDQLREISYAVLNRKKHYAPCKNMMFYGPPGTGKTLFAKKLAI